jgi:AraC-like DNA-binding protein
LAASGQSFNALLDATRKRAAEQYLSDARLSIAEVAYLLGYSEPAAFHRAFRRWTRMTPQTFRRAALA